MSTLATTLDASGILNPFECIKPLYTRPVDAYVLYGRELPKCLIRGTLVGLGRDAPQGLLLTL